MTSSIKQALALLPKLSISYDKNGLQELNEFPMLPHYRNILIAALRILEPIAAGTHVIVPVEPTEAMVIAGQKPPKALGTYLTGDSVISRYSAMITTSQEPKL